jgi:hypothetical protein
VATNGPQGGSLLVLLDRFVQRVSLQESIAAVDAVTFEDARDRIAVDSAMVTCLGSSLEPPTMRVGVSIDRASPLPTRPR